MSNLVPLKNIPYAARQVEAAARRHQSRAAAFEAARFRIVLAPGCYQGSYSPSVGWVLTREAAVALSERVIHMPNNTSHTRLRFVEES